MLQKGFILQISFLFAFCIFWKNREDQIFFGVVNGSWSEISLLLLHFEFDSLNLCSTRKYRKFIFSIQLQIWNFLPKNEILKIPIDQCLPKAKLDSDIVWKMPPNNAISDYRCSVFGFAPPLWRLCLHPSTYHFHSFYLHTESILYLPINPQMGFVGG